MYQTKGSAFDQQYHKSKLYKMSRQVSLKAVAQIELETQLSQLFKNTITEVLIDDLRGIVHLLNLSVSSCLRPNDLVASFPLINTTHKFLHSNQFAMVK